MEGDEARGEGAGAVFIRRMAKQCSIPSAELSTSDRAERQ